MSIQDKIVSIAKSYLGEKEVPNNMGFQDKVFEKKMKDVGFEKGFAWCSLFAELVWTEAYSDNVKLKSKIAKLCSASATTTFKNYDIDKTFKTSKTPVLGSIVIWRHGSNWQGHAGVVTSIIDSTTFKSVEGNTNAAGGREGIEVAEKIRKTNNPFSESGLNIVGFITPL